MVENLAESEKLAALAPVSSKAKSERIPEELVTRFFAYGDGLEDYKESPSRFIFEYVKKMNEAFDANAALEDQYRDRFDRMIKFVEAPRSRTEPKPTGKCGRQASHPG